MEDKQFAALMPYICADLVAMISSQKNISEKEAIEKLYASKLYEALENEDTKFWHYSTVMLYSIFEKEELTGILVFPDV